MSRKSMKMNLLLMRINVLEVKLILCAKRLREYYLLHEKNQPPAVISRNEFENSGHSRSIDDLLGFSRMKYHYQGAGDSNIEEDDSQVLVGLDSDVFSKLFQ